MFEFENSLPFTLEDVFYLVMFSILRYYWQIYGFKWQLDDDEYEDEDEEDEEDEEAEGEEEDEKFEEVEEDKEDIASECSQAYTCTSEKSFSVGYKPSEHQLEGLPRTITGPTWTARSPVCGEDSVLHWDEWDLSEDLFAQTHRLLREHSSGGQGTISLWSSKVTNEVFAAKKVCRCKETGLEKSLNSNPQNRSGPTKATSSIRESQFQTIIERLQQARRNIAIVEIFSFDTMYESSYLTTTRMVMEFCNGGDLRQYKQRCDKGHTKVPEDFIWSVYKQLVKALVFLHEGFGREAQYRDSTWAPIIHRDIKPENVFLKQDPACPNGYPLCKLGDFDLATFFYDDGCKNGDVGTYCWQPPEQWANMSLPRATPAGDVWAIGAIIQYLATGITAGAVRPGGLSPDMIRMYETQVIRRTVALTPAYSVELQNCLNLALEKDPAKRADARTILREVSLWYEFIPNELPVKAYFRRTKGLEPMFSYLSFNGWQVGTDCV